MKFEAFYLKDYFSFLGEEGRNPVVNAYFPQILAEMKRYNQKRPCLIVCPGGGYGFCSQREAEPIALHFLPEGYNVFVINYSVAPHRFPTQLCEIAALMELIYKNADEWHCDTNRILISGFSAGGHLAAHYSTMYDCKEVREVFPESKPVNGSILCYPVITADPNHSHGGSFVSLTGHKTPTDEDINYFSCDRNVKENTPPAYIWHTAADNVVPVENSLLYAKALSKYNIPFELHIFPFGWHGLSTADIHTCDGITEHPQIFPYVNSWLNDVKKWLKVMGFTD